MENSEHLYAEDTGLRFVVIGYSAVMLAVFVIGFYGLLSLFWLASAEIQQSAHIVASLP